MWREYYPKSYYKMYNYKWSDMVKCKRLYNFSLRNILSLKVHCHEWWVIKFLMLQRSLSLLWWQIFSWLNLFCYTENTCFVATKLKIILLKLPVLVGNLYTNIIILVPKVLPSGYKLCKMLCLIYSGWYFYWLKWKRKKNSGLLSPQSFQQFVQNANHVHIKKFVPWENVHA